MSNFGKRFDPVRMRQSDIDRMLGAFPLTGRHGRTGLRNRALFVVLWRSGLRCAEACALDLADVELLESGAAAIRVREPKGYHREKNPTDPRTVGMGAGAVEILKEWLKVRGGEPGPLFFTSSGKPVSTRYVRAMFKRVANRGGIDRRVHPHAMRHTFAGELDDEGVNLLEIMGALGHVNLNTTQIYVKKHGSAVVRATTERKF